jgi:NTP pyrophosphatase (non-canonical NTP hydrolase)
LIGSKKGSEMENLTDLQKVLFKWCDKNFPLNNEDGTEQFLGVVEEVGELSHVILKKRQEIRGYFKKDPKAKAEAQDAVGDIVIYMMNYCSYQGWNFDKILRETADKVMGRDWNKFPKNGVNR